MSLIPVTGTTAVVKIGGSTIPGINWTLSIDPKITKNASNFRDGRVSVATLTDAQLKLTLVWDDNAPPTLTAGFDLRPGTSVTVDCYTDGSNYFVFPGVVGPADVTNPGLEDVLGYSLTVELSGSITYPSNG